jgi:hypothetical protein
MKMKIEKTKVIFRKVPANYSEAGASILALFPEIPGDMSPATCLSYAHHGQHGAAMASGHGWPLATPEECASLARELVAIGYVLDVRTRSCPAYYRTRLAALRA